MAVLNKTNNMSSCADLSMLCTPTRVSEIWNMEVTLAITFEI